MPSLVESVSPIEAAPGAAVALLAAVTVGIGYYRPSPPAAAALVLLSGVLVARGLRPFGETVAYHLLQAAAFVAFGLTVVATGSVTAVAAAAVVVGGVGVLNYGWRGARNGLWTSVSE